MWDHGVDLLASFAPAIAMNYIQKSNLNQIKMKDEQQICRQK